jgi:hypothetical protein
MQSMRRVEKGEDEGTEDYTCLKSYRRENLRTLSINLEKWNDLGVVL